MPASPLISPVLAFVQKYMAHYDGSHDFSHILRVLGTAHALRAQSPSRYDATTVTLAALLHDVGDKKYLLPGQDSATAVRDVLLSLGAPADLADKIQTIVSAVSYTAEVADPQRVRDVIARFPELEVVQDADRLDAVGAIGIARTFAYGGAKGDGGLYDTMRHFGEKLERLEEMMKTPEGKRMARERSVVLAEFREEFWKESGGAVGGLEAVEGLEGLADLVGVDVKAFIGGV